MILEYELPHNISMPPQVNPATNHPKDETMYDSDWHGWDHVLSVSDPNLSNLLLSTYQNSGRPTDLAQFLTKIVNSIHNNQLVSLLCSRPFQGHGKPRSDGHQIEYNAHFPVNFAAFLYLFEFLTVGAQNL